MQKNGLVSRKYRTVDETWQWASAARHKSAHRQTDRRTLQLYTLGRQPIALDSRLFSCRVRNSTCPAIHVDSRGAARTTLAYAERHEGTRPTDRGEVCHRSDVPPPAAPTFEQWVVHGVASVRSGMVQKKSTPTPDVHQTLFPPLVRPWPAGGGVIIGRG